MSWIDQLRDRIRSVSAGDELLYEIAADEMDAGHLRRGLWTKALAECDFDEPKAKAKYLRMRVSELQAAIPQVTDICRDLQTLAEERDRLDLQNRDAAQEAEQLDRRLTPLAGEETLAWSDCRRSGEKIRIETRRRRITASVALTTLCTIGSFVAAALFMPIPLAIAMSVLGAFLGWVLSLMAGDAIEARHPNASQRRELRALFTAKRDEKARVEFRLASIRVETRTRQAELDSVSTRLAELERHFASVLNQQRG